jgi:hypothetical protein
LAADLEPDSWLTGGVRLHATKLSGLIATKFTVASNEWPKSTQSGRQKRHRVI